MVRKTMPCGCYKDTWLLGESTVSHQAENSGLTLLVKHQQPVPEEPEIGISAPTLVHTISTIVTIFTLFHIVFAPYRAIPGHTGPYRIPDRSQAQGASLAFGLLGIRGRSCRCRCRALWQGALCQPSPAVLRHEKIRW